MKKILKTRGFWLLTYQVTLIILLPIYLTSKTPSSLLLWISFTTMALSFTSITVGYHRGYSHISFKPNKAFEFFLVFFGSVSFQSSVIRWANDHRNHHAFLDTAKDPYSIKKGFWHAHFLWLFDPQTKVETKTVADLLRNKLLLNQHNFSKTWMLLTNLLIFGLSCYLTNDTFGSFVFTVLARTFVVHHCSWFINSIAHTYGSQTYSTEHSAFDNFIISLFTNGEGYHNYHHTFPTDYRNGVKWFNFDPGKWLIWTLNKLGVVSNLKKVSSKQILKQLVLNDKLKIEKHLLRHPHMIKGIEIANSILNYLERKKYPFFKQNKDLYQKINEWKYFLKTNKNNLSHIN